MDKPYINRDCIHYDFGDTAPRAYGAFCKLKKCSITEANCAECKENKMLPCPFCGGEAELCYTNDNHHKPYVQCRFGVHLKPPCTAGQYKWQYKTEQEAIEAWNRRATCK